MLKEPEQSSEKRWAQGLPPSRTTCSSSPAQALGSGGSAQNKTHPRPHPVNIGPTRSLTARDRRADLGPGHLEQDSERSRPSTGVQHRVQGSHQATCEGRKGTSERGLTATQPPLRLCIEEKPLARVQQRPCLKGGRFHSCSLHMPGMQVPALTDRGNYPRQPIEVSHVDASFFLSRSLLCSL